MAEKSNKYIFDCYAEEVVREMKGIVYDFLASKFHSVSICRAFCYLKNKTWTHQKLNFKCFCCECRLKELFK